MSATYIGDMSIQDPFATVKIWRRLANDMAVEVVDVVRDRIDGSPIEVRWRQVDGPGKGKVSAVNWWSRYVPSRIEEAGRGTA